MLQINNEYGENEKEVFIMEKKQKNLISIFLLVVGVIFILVAGEIFVTTAWKYLPVFVKQLALLVVAGGMFGGSRGLAKNNKLSWISETLFHLGNAFVGFFVIAIMGGVVENGIIGNAFKIMTASFAMATIVGIKLVSKKSAFDFAALSLLVDTLLISGCIALKTTFYVYMYLLAGFVMALAVFDALQRKLERKDGFSLCVGIIYLLHTVYYTLLAGFASMFVLDGYEDASFVRDAIIWFGVVVAITGLTWKARKNVAIRVFNSLATLWFTFVAVYGICGNVLGVGNFSVIMILVVFIATVLMIWLDRAEITGLMVAAAVVIPFGQLLFYVFDSLGGLFGGIEKNWSTTYNPYSVMIGGGMLALYIVKYGCENIFTDWKESRLLKFAGLQMVTGCIMWFASKMVASWAMVFYLLVAINMMFMVIVLKNETAKRVFSTLAMLACMTAIGVQPFVEIADGYNVEWVCFLIGLGIVLFRVIWYDYKDKLSMVYFIATCILLITLLLHNLSVEGLGNVMILGVTGIVMLVLASMKNDKKYVVASSITLILLVLYLTREFWLSIAWWVYLFVAGVVLVLLAVKKAKEA